MLARSPQGEANANLLLLTEEFGLIRARAQGIRNPGAKLAGALQTFFECEVVLIRGKDTWRISGATLERSFASELSVSARLRAGRISSLLARLIRGESSDPSAFLIFQGLLDSLITATEPEGEVAECLAALRILRGLGLDAGEIPGEESSYDEETLKEASAARKGLVMRVNRGIKASGL